MPAKPKKTKEQKAAEKLELTANFFKDLALKVPEASREFVTKIAAAAAENVDASNFVAENTMRLADYSRGHNDLAQQTVILEEAKKRAEAQYADNISWRSMNVAEFDRMKLASEAAPDDDLLVAPVAPVQAPAVPPGYIREEDVKNMFDARDQQSMKYEALVADLRHRHTAAFGEFLDVGELVALATKTGLGLEAAYTEAYRERTQDKTDADLKERITRERKEAGDEVRLELSKTPALPYVVNNAEPTALDILSGNAKDLKTGHQAAVDDYWEMQRAKAAGG